MKIGDTVKIMINGVPVHGKIQGICDNEYMVMTGKHYINYPNYIEFCSKSQLEKWNK